jgi:hypothetical protein
MKKYLAIVCFFLSIQNAFAVCKNAETRIIYQAKPELSNEVLCEHSVGKLLFYVSKSCEENSSPECEILKRPKKNIVIKNYRSNFGSPGFKLCSELGGVPQIFDFKFNQKDQWKTSERCFFEKDFVEVSLLTNEWKKFIK